MYEMSDLQYQAVYNILSFSLASMMATTMYLWFRAFAVQERFRSAVLISGLVTFIAAYHYVRIFNSWVGAYHYSPGTLHGGAMELANPTLTGVPFNDAYHYSPGTLHGGAMELANPTLTGVPFNDAYHYSPGTLHGGAMELANPT